MIYIVNATITTTHEIPVEACSKDEAQKFVDDLTVEHVMDYGHPYAFEGPNDKTVHVADENELRRSWRIKPPTTA